MREAEKVKPSMTGHRGYDIRTVQPMGEYDGMGNWAMPRVGGSIEPAVLAATHAALAHSGVAVGRPSGVAMKSTETW